MLYREEYTGRKGSQVIKKIILLSAGLLFGFLISRILFVTYITGDTSMLPGLKKGSRVIIFKQGTPENGDIILFESPVNKDRTLLRRVIATGNDTVEIKNKAILVNGKQLEYKWKIKREDTRILPAELTYRDNMKKLKINNGEYFVIGDNIDNAYDSRTLGIIESDRIIGYMIYSF
jgi:signal peptidase I